MYTYSYIYTYIYTVYIYTTYIKPLAIWDASRLFVAEDLRSAPGQQFEKTGMRWVNARDFILRNYSENHGL